MNRVTARIAIFGVVILGFIGYRVFFVNTDEVLDFNDEMVDMLRKSDERHVSISTYLTQYTQGKKVNVDLMRTERDSLQKNIQKDLDTLKDIEIPDDELCLKFHKSSLAYLDNSLEITKKYVEVIDHISQHNPGKKEEIQKARKLLAELVARDQELLQAAGKCQEEMAAEYDIELR